MVKDIGIFEKDSVRLADFFKVFADPSRLRILHRLIGVECSVGELAESLDMTQSAMSHQLRVLKESRLVKARRDGKSIIYSLTDDHVVNVIEQGLEHINE